ncbi:hypothetical protein FLM48_02740 [Shewanella sp. Scap07]|uniref:hypothetical protein n=1 Tax=Shewanella sp. Scap07 TaxID=2589987 RepID=UPI0015C08F48|nr:hypothetical protein [Shewanella sp. Scap07]QLE84097.1 hypothetical protein FLM48_02740 [Shewanella sp. Scap07]
MNKPTLLLAAIAALSPLSTAQALMCAPGEQYLLSAFAVNTSEPSTQPSSFSSDEPNGFVSEFGQLNLHMIDCHTVEITTFGEQEEVFTVRSPKLDLCDSNNMKGKITLKGKDAKLTIDVANGKQPLYQFSYRSYTDEQQKHLFANNVIKISQ